MAADLQTRRRNRKLYGRLAPNDFDALFSATGERGLPVMLVVSDNVEAVLPKTGEAPQ